MLDIFLKPPGLYILILFIIALGSLIYWKRGWVKEQLKRLRIKEIGLGPVKIEPKPEQRTASLPEGVSFGKNNEFSQATIQDIVGGSRTTKPVSTKEKSSVDFGTENVFTDAHIEGITGGDVVGDDS